MSTPEAARPAAPTPTPTPPKKALAVTALVLSCLFFIPLVPTIGLVLGIVALATGRAKTISIVAVCLGAFFTFFIVIEAAVAIPAFMKYIRRSKSVEATMNTRRLATTLAAMPAADWAKLPDADWTPPGSACGQPNQRFAPDPQAFAGEPWRTLGFSVDDPHYYQYRVARSGNGFVVEARGDLDCDGLFSRFSIAVTPDGPGPLSTENEIE